METFKRFKRLKIKEIIDLQNTIQEIKSQPEKRKKLLEYIEDSLSPRTRSFIPSPQVYLDTLEIHLETLQSPNELETDQQKQLSSYKHQYLLAGLQENPFHPDFEKTEQDEVWGKKIKQEKAKFNRLEKEAQVLYGKAINQIDVSKKESGLVEALALVPIGGDKSLQVLKALAKVILGHSVGKNNTHSLKDEENKTLLKEKNNQQKVA